MQYDGSVRFKTEIDANNVTSQMQTVINALKKSEVEAARLKARMEELGKTKIATQEYKEIQKQIEQTEAKLNALLEKKERFRGSHTSATWLNMNSEIEELQNSLPYLEGELEDLVETGKAFTLGKDGKEFERLSDKLNVVNGRIQAGETRLQELMAKQKPISSEMDRLAKKSKKAFSNMASGAKKSGSLLSTFASRLKGIALSLLVFNWITKAFNAMISGMKKGFENLAKYSSDYAQTVQDMKNAMATLGNQFAAAFSPIIQMVIPWLMSLVNALSTAMTYVAQFVALLSGKNTFTRAKQVQDGYNKSLGGTAKAADKARGALAKFDDLDVWSKQEEASGGGDGAANMFEEVPVDPKLQKWLDGLKEKLGPILEYVKKLKDIFLEGFSDGLGDWEYRLDIIKTGLEQIKNALIEIWTDATVLGALDTFVQSVVYMLGSLVGSIASIGLTIGAALIGGLGDYLENNTERIKGFLTNAFNIGAEITTLLADAFQSIAYIFEAFASENGIRFVSGLIGTIAGAAMSITELALQLGRDFLAFFTLPIVENQEGIRIALEGLLGAAATILEGFKTSIDDLGDSLNKIYTEHFKPFFDSVTETLTQWVGTFTTVFNSRILPVIQKIAERVSELWTKYITPLVTAVVEFFGNMATLLQNYWVSFLAPLVDWIIQYVVPILAEGIGFIIDVVLLGIEGLVAAITFFIDIINGFVELWNEAWTVAGEYFDVFWLAIDEATKAIGEIIDLFIEAVSLAIDGDWKGAWNNAKQIMDLFEEKVSAIAEAVRGILGGLFDWISQKVSAAIDAIKGLLSFGTPSYSGGQKNTMAPSYSARAVDSIPQLASGTVIRGGNPFLAILGDQVAGQTNIEAPLSTIKQAVREELSGLGTSTGTKVVLRVSGTDLAEVMLPDFMAEMNRQGYDVEVLGGAQ